MKNALALLLLVVSLLVLTFVIFVSFSEGSASGRTLANRDFVAYWSAGQLLVQGRDPYDPDAVLRLEQSVGYTQERPVIMRNPPPALVLALPLGLLRLQSAAIVWFLLLIAAIMLSIRLLWAFNGRPKSSLHLIAYVFAPTIACLITGQTSAFILLGLTLFLYLVEKHPFRAGLCLAFCAIKPHLFLPLGTVLLLWTGWGGAYRLLAGAVSGVTFAMALPLFLLPSVWSDYFAMARNSGLNSEFIPTFGSLLRIAIDRNAVWLQALPAVLGACWSVWYFRRHRAHWNWHSHGMLLLLVSLLVAPYAWLTDEIVLLPAILRGAYLASQRFLAALFLLNGIAVFGVVLGVPLQTGVYVWTTAAWLIWYASATNRSTGWPPGKSVAL